MIRFETKRLILAVLEPSPSAARQALHFYNKNRIIFERCEVIRPADFYTEEYQKSLLELDKNLMDQKKCIRFWVFEKDHPETMIGTICFYNILAFAYNSCETGYKFDSDYWHKGYAREAMSFGIWLMFEQFRIHRITAYVMEDNLPSIRLLNDLGFFYEGTCRKNIQICGVWEDHMLFAKLK